LNGNYRNEQDDNLAHYFKWTLAFHTRVLSGQLFKIENLKATYECVCVTWIIMSVGIPYAWSSATNICCTFILQKLLFNNICTKLYFERYHS